MKLDKRQVICVSLGIILALAVTFVEKQDTVLTKGNGLERNTYGQGETQQEILVEGLLAKKVPLAVRIGERRYTKEEAADAIHMAAEELSAQIAGGNESLEQVQSRLELVTWLDKYGISVRWQPDDTELISASGEVFNSGCPESGRETFLTATLKAGEYAEDYIYRVNVLPPGRTQEEKELAAFENFLMEKEEEQKYSEVFILPEEFEGKTLTYSADRGCSSLMFPLLGILAAILLPLKDRQREQEAKKKRECQMMMDYSEILSRLVVFLGAGLPVRKAWAKIVEDYRRTEEKAGKRAAYEEMAAAYYLMQRGVPEIQAYSEFGNRCRVLPYRKLAGILEQNVKNGSKSLTPVLEAEMEAAFEQRKNLARRLGEEASTKLLLPLFMMLLIVMVMITVPAFLAFGI
ncbi:MAG: immunoglobulin-like domain-containing protein [[Clostridium] symbiosum]|nr:immunoglobulin-like domain-containing protein [[Clostridium] symbiosum]